MPTLGHCKEQRRKISIRSARSAGDLVGTLSSATEPTFLHSLEKRCSDIVQKTPTLGPGLAWLAHCSIAATHEAVHYLPRTIKLDCLVKLPLGWIV